MNGQEIQVPKLDYSRAEKILDAIYDWNQEHPEDFIRIRGHVLVEICKCGASEAGHPQADYRGGRKGALCLRYRTGVYT